MLAIIKNNNAKKYSPSCGKYNSIVKREHKQVNSIINFFRMLEVSATAPIKGDIIETIIAQIAIEFVHIEVPTLSLGAINSTKKVL